MAVLHTNNLTLIARIQDNDADIVYFGKKLSNSYDDATINKLVTPPLAQAGLDEVQTLSLASTYASGTFLNPAIKSHHDGQNWVVQWTHVEAKQHTHSLDIIFNDSHAKLELVLSIVADVKNDAFSFDVAVTNKGEQNLDLSQWLTTLPIPKSFKKIMHFSGRWVNEFQPVQSDFPIGSLELTNLKGRTSQDHFPGLLVAENEFSFDHGFCIGYHLGWSGNHSQRIERNQLGLSQYQAGIHLMPGEAILTTNETFNAATLYMTASFEGLGGISKNFQTFVRDNILTFPTKMERPIHVNTWEAVYFDHNKAGLDALAEASQGVGAERFVLDDGWFKGRRDDTAGLGDWTIDQDIYPRGLVPLAQTLKDKGLEFGLWFEPEMVSERSDLFKAHPEWVLGIEHRQQTTGRNQWVLDLSNDDVCDFLFESIDNILVQYPIRYIKWDMNRDLLQAGDINGKASYAKYVNSLYALLARIRSAHPLVEIESCSSGGGRMDYGILKHTHRFWLSDCNDALERQRMQQWASIFFPAEVLGSHIGPHTSHTTRRTHSLQARAATALFGHLGIEWDIRHLTSQEHEELVGYLNLYKYIRKDIHSGIRAPLTCPDENQIGFTVQSGANTYVSIYQETMPKFSVPGDLQLPKLDSQKNYAVSIVIEPVITHHLMKQKPPWFSEDNFEVSGEWLKNKGLPLPVLDPETVLIIKLTRL
ncbi:alpha-galactosidase [Reinekea sp.]|jgi:alpha-galactosidase|uniref:alpha-galactosidase n=1 Tax=Reinekea sp. TaxID=1970455 RepID=UPI00398A0648